MAKIEDGTSGAILAGVDPGNKALRVSPRPLDALGHYRYSGSTGALTGLGAYSELFQLRWTDAQTVALVQFVRIRCVQTAAFTAAQELAAEVIAATGVTIAGSGGVQLLPTAMNFKKSSSMPQSRANELRMASTAALGTGTRTLSPAPVLAPTGWAGGTGDVIVDATLDMTGCALEYPLVLQQNESLIVRLGQFGMAAGGRVRVSVDVAWAEMVAASF